MKILPLNILDKYKSSRYGIGFDRKGFFSVDNGVGKNARIFGVDMSSSQHIKKQHNNMISNKVIWKKYILSLGKGRTFIHKD